MRYEHITNYLEKTLHELSAPQQVAALAEILPFLSDFADGLGQRLGVKRGAQPKPRPPKSRYREPI